MSVSATETTMIRLDRQTADALVARAAVRGMSIDDYLRWVAEHDRSPVGGGSAPMSLAEFDRWLDELAADPSPTRSLPADFSRADIYDDHD